MSPPDPRQEVVQVCRLAWQKGLMAASDGNVSLRLPGGGILITPHGRSKALLSPQELIEVDVKGQVKQGQGRPSAELGLHLAVYAARPSARAVIHAHPPTALAFTLAGRTLSCGALPELLVDLGEVPVVPYATPASDELARAVAPYAARHQALLLERHGSLTLGKNLARAWELAERLEHAAQTLLAASVLGGFAELDPDEQARLRLLGGKGRPEPPGPLSQRVELVTLPLSEEFLREKRHRDQRGEAHLIFNGRPLQRVGFLTLLPGQGFRGGHFHRRKSEGMYVVSGRGSVDLVAVDSNERQTWPLEPGQRIWLPPGVAHRFWAAEPLALVEVCDRPFEAEDDLPFDFGEAS